MGRRSRSVQRRRSEAASAPPASGRRLPSSRILVALGLFAALVVAAGGLTLVAVNAAQPVYVCGSLLSPAAPIAGAARNGAALQASPSAGTAAGQDAPDLGRNHVPLGERVTYQSCPPTSGPHYNAAGQGPIPHGFYGPDRTTPPQGWIHNLEHGAMVVLYRCPDGACEQSTLDALRAFQQTIPPSPQCHIPDDVVVTRFDDMKAPIAAVTWDRVLFLDSVDAASLTRFFLTSAETKAPEKEC